MKDNANTVHASKALYRTTKINNRRFLGNKYKLLDFIKGVVESECEDIEVVADIFAGTGAVASAFTDKKIITNDIMYSNYICNVAWFSPEEYDTEKIKNLIIAYNTLQPTEENYMSINFADTYFSRQDCKKIGYIREDIENQFIQGKINSRERALLITSLLYAMDKIANTCGHYDAYRKGVKFEKTLEMSVPVPEEYLNEENECYNMDANQLVKSLQADLVYIDPPYNSRQYCDAYHLLENVARWEKPEVFGVAKKMDRSGLKSDYCTSNATKSFEQLVDSIAAKYILLSYNNMAEKGHNRSNAKISDDDIMRILQKKGEVKVFSESYKAFTAGKSDIQQNEERLFLCICKEQHREIIPSALNYIGGKYKLLPQILPYFPEDIDSAVDLLCGGCNVGINLKCDKVLFADSDAELMGLINTLRKLDSKVVLDFVYKNIEKYNLSLSCQNGYECYGCESSSGLGKYNKEGFLKLRSDFNSKEEKDDEYYLLLYLLVVYSFNNQIRFNSQGKFNLPVGKRDFNSKMQKKLLDFMDRIKKPGYSFECMDFRKIDLDKLTGRSFVYADPPYLIACATYNEGDGWTKEDEYALLNFLDEIDRRGIRFALSNVLEGKGNKNEILMDWISHHPGYRVINLNYSYSNSNYHIKVRDVITREVLIVNY